ncbi:hypothetical protein OHU11_30060 [Streptomyces sp. NBC_00257]|uniref:WDGH domain-containing protein n=1 Tax=unclassified Streptomyces TaxID=2593676 RepID=UPI002257DA16|nr:MULTISPECIES: hypothetical protein [unclassified Streptomyces]MCX5431897.1 hypothetical protein [Streptomyces sp. NBC_00062]
MSDRIRLDDLTDADLDALYDQLDATYRERAHFVAHLASLHPSHIGHTDQNLPDWAVVTIETPAGQMSWHIAPRDMDLFTRVQPTNRICRGWDGHTTNEKYQRMRDLTEATPSLLPLDVIAEHQREHIKQLTARVAELEHAEQGDRAAAALDNSTIKAWHTRAEQAEAAIARVRKLATRWAILRTYGGAAYELRKALDEKPAETTPLVHQSTKPQASHSAGADEPAIDEQQPTTEADRA